MKILPTLFYVAAMVACSGKSAPVTQDQAPMEKTPAATAASAQAGPHNPAALTSSKIAAAWSPGSCAPPPKQAMQAQIATSQPSHRQNAVLTWKRFDGPAMPTNSLASRPGDNVGLRPGDQVARLPELPKQTQERVISVPNSLTRIQAEPYQNERIAARIKRIEASGALQTFLPELNRSPDGQNTKPAHNRLVRPGDTVGLRPGDKVARRPVTPQRTQERVDSVPQSHTRIRTEPNQHDRNVLKKLEAAAEAGDTMKESQAGISPFHAGSITAPGSAVEVPKKQQK